MGVACRVSGLTIAALLVLAAGAAACPCGTNCGCGSGCQCGTGGSAGAGTLLPPPPPPPPGSLGVRKNVNALTDQEKEDFVHAVLTLKNTFRPGESLSIYDTFVQVHAQAFLNGQAHGGPAFLPWHRQFLADFERELQLVNPRVTIPYWDFVVDRGTTGGPWTPNFMGGNGNPFNGYVVEDGPFRQGQWKLQFDGPDLRRSFGLLLPTLPKAEDVAAALGVPSYDAFPWSAGTLPDESFRQSIEGFGHLDPENHNRVHLWIGGSSAIIYSPNDPIFWLLHANIDRIWAEWQDVFGDSYLPLDNDPTAPLGHRLDDPMFPFGVTPAQTLDHRALGYVYDTELTAVPEPGTATLLTLGVLTVLAWRWRSRRGLAAVPPAQESGTRSQGSEGRFPVS
jgi:tyrosinase